LSDRGIRRNVIEENLHAHVYKCYLGSSSPWEWCRVLEKYQDRFENINLLIMDLDLRRFLHYEPKLRYDRFMLLKRPWEWRYPYISSPCKKPNLTTSILPLRLSISSIRKSRVNKKIKWDFTPDSAVKNNFKLYEAVRQEIRSYNIGDKMESISFTGNMEIDDGMIQSARDIIDFCKKKGIYVVIVATPMIQGSPYALPNIYSTDPGKQKYLKLLSELNGRSNCSVITLRSLQEIVPNIDDDELFSDQTHMTPKGSAFFTPWLADQMLKDPNIITALKTPRKPEEFFVKKICKKGYKKVTSYFKKKTDTDIKIAQP
jgi:hypothetical protein